MPPGQSFEPFGVRVEGAGVGVDVGPDRSSAILIEPGCSGSGSA